MAVKALPVAAHQEDELGQWQERAVRFSTAAEPGIDHRVPMALRRVPRCLPRAVRGFPIARRAAQGFLAQCPSGPQVWA